MTLSDKKTKIEVQVKPLSDALGRILWNIMLKRRRAVQTHQRPKEEWEGLVLLDFATSGALRAVWSSCDDEPKSAAETTAATEEEESGRVSALRAGRRSRAKAEAMNLLADIALVPSCDSPAEMILA